jgi:hypothetical protein
MGEARESRGRVEGESTGRVESSFRVWRCRGIHRTGPRIVTLHVAWRSGGGIGLDVCMGIGIGINGPSNQTMLYEHSTKQMATTCTYCSDVLYTA